MRSRASHQLSPFAVIGAAIVLAALGRISLSGLPTVMIVILGTWLSYMTVTYMQGHLSDMIARIGSVDDTVAANLTDRFRGSPDHLAVLVVRSVSSVLLWSLAAVGSARQILSRRVDLTWTLLAGAPFALLLLQSYGGEILLRVYLFALPFMSLLAASALLGSLGRRPPRRVLIAVLAGSMLFLASFLIARYGNERMDMITPDEATGMARLYEIAPTDAQLVALSDNVFWKYRDYELYHYAVVTDAALDLDVPAIVDAMRARPESVGYLIVSRAQRAALELSYSMPPGRWAELQTALAETPGVRVAYQNPDITHLRREPDTMKRWSLASHILLVGLALAAEVVVFTSAAGPLRTGLPILFVLVAPGWAAVRLLGLPMSLLTFVTTAIGISISIDILLAMTLFYVRWWSVEVAMTILLVIVITLVLADLPVLRRAVRRLWAPSAVTS